MAKLLKLRRGTTSQHSGFTGAEGEVTVDTDKETLIVHDGSTAGGHAVAAEDMANVSSADIAGRLGTDSIATSKIAGGALPTDVTVASANIVNGTIATADIAGDAIDGTKIADNAINSEHYVDGSIDHAHLANDCVNADNIQDDSINSEHYVDASIDHQHLSNDCIDGDNIQNDVINSEHYAAGSIDHEHLANDCVNADNIQNDSINSEHYVADSIDTEHYAPNSVNSDALSHTSVSAGSYGSATAIPSFTVDAQGRLTAASTNALSAGGMTLLSTTTVGSNGISSVSLSLSGYQYLYGMLYGVTRSGGSAISDIAIRFNGSSGTNYEYTKVRMDNAGNSSRSAFKTTGFFYNMTGVSGWDSGVNQAYFELHLVNEGVRKPFNMNAGGESLGGSISLHTNGFFDATAAITSITIFATDTNLTGGTLKLFGVK